MINGSLCETEVKKTMSKVKFNLLGKKLVISEARDRYVTLRKRYDQLAIEMAKEYEKLYYKETEETVDDEHGYDEGCEVIEKAIHITIEEFKERGIYEIDETVLKQKYFYEYNDWKKYFRKVNKYYLDNRSSFEEEIEEVAEAVETADEFKQAVPSEEQEGEAFPEIKGDAEKEAIDKGVDEKPALDKMGSAVKTVKELGAKVMSSINLGASKPSIYKDAETFARLQQGVYTNVFNIHYAVMRALMRLKGYEYSYVTQLNNDKANAIVNHLDKITTDLSTTIIGVLEADPFDIDIYEYMIKKGLDKKAELAPIAEYFGVNIKGVVNSSLLAYYNEAEKDTEEQLKSIEQYIVKSMESYHLKSCEALDKTRERLKNIDIEKRTFKDYTYHTREEKHLAEKEDSKLKERCKNINNYNREELRQLREALQEENHIGNVADQYIEAITVRIQKLEDAILGKHTENIEKLDRATLLKLLNQIEHLDYTYCVVEKYVTKVNKQIDNLEHKVMLDMCHNLEEKTREQLFTLQKSISALDFRKANKDYFIHLIDEAILNYEETEMSRLCEGLEEKEEKECNKIREMIEKLDYDEALKDKYISRILKRIDAIWNEEDSKVFNKIYLNTDIYDAVSIAQSKSYIENSGRTEGKKDYLNALDALNEKNLNKAKQYIAFSKKGFLKTFCMEIVLFICAAVVSFMMRDNVFGIVASVIWILICGHMVWKNMILYEGKKIYSVLTLNEKIIHPELK